MRLPGCETIYDDTAKFFCLRKFRFMKMIHQKMALKAKMPMLWLFDNVTGSINFQIAKMLHFAGYAI
jgi:hypothetical protein